MGTLHDILMERVKHHVQLAVGCTEPVAVGFTAAKVRELLGGTPEQAKVTVSKNIYKNGKSVCIPGTEEAGLTLAAAIGLVREKPGEGLMVFSGVTQEEIAEGKALEASGAITLETKDGCSDVFVEISAQRGKDKALCRLEEAHDRISYMEKNGKKIFALPVEESQSDTELSHVELKDLLAIVDSVSDEEIRFLQAGIDHNFQAAEEGLNNAYGLGLGSHLKDISNGPFAMDGAMETRILTAAAADMRMGGGTFPIMTSGGSGNQGIGVVIPIVTVANHEQISDEKRNRAVLFGHLMNELVKIHSGKLSGMCGCAIGAGVGAAAGITWCCGTEEEVERACNIMFANLSGMLCDGAKDTCSLKLSTCAYEAVVTAYLALSGMPLQDSVGVVGDSLGETIRNIGYLSREAFPVVDEKILDLMQSKDRGEVREN